MSIAEKLPPYIPPPWRQKNPLMEKACRAYHKNTAPEKARKALDRMEFEWINRRYGELTSEILASGYAGTYSKLEEGMATTVLVKWEYKKYELPILLVVIFYGGRGNTGREKRKCFPPSRKTLLRGGNRHTL